MFTTFVINLDKDTERMDFMREQLAKLGMPFLRHPAVLGKAYTPSLQEYNEVEAIRLGRHALLPGEMGCALSHAQVIARVVEESLPYALILEDDVTLPPNFKSIIECEIARNNGDWEYLLFDYVPVGLPFLRQWWNGVVYHITQAQKKSFIRTVLLIVSGFIKALYIVPLSLFEGWREARKQNNPGPVRFFRPVYFAGTYLVTQSGAQKLYELSHPVVYTADHLPNKARRLKQLRFRGYCPLIVKQEKETFGSSILDMSGRDMNIEYK